MAINEEKLFEKVLQACALSVLSFGVTYVRNIGIETVKLNENFIQFKYEMRALGDKNNAITEKLNNHESRLNTLEKKRK